MDLNAAAVLKKKGTKVVFEALLMGHNSPLDG